MSSVDSITDLLTVRLEHRVGNLQLDVRFALQQPWTVLFGPSGSGKTTVLRAIAGFLRPDAGTIHYCDRVLIDLETGVFLPAHRRPVRIAAQHTRLFPHMSVLENVLYGSGWSARPDAERELAQELLALFQIGELAERRPRQLSGGEQKRVSAARAALAAATFSGPENALLLLDEPFVGLDAALRDELLLKLSAWTAVLRIPVLSVTHDVGEAFLLNAEVIRIAEGKVVVRGPVEVVLAGERRRLLDQLSDC